VIAILIQGSLAMTIGGRTYVLSVPGTAYVFSADGTVQGPIAWDGTLFHASPGVKLPLYGLWYPNEPAPNPLPGNNLHSIDQLNAIIQQSLTPPPPPPPPPVLFGNRPSLR
jgi:hypothetical protein